MLNDLYYHNMYGGMTMEQNDVKKRALFLFLRKIPDIIDDHLEEMMSYRPIFKNHFENRQEIVRAAITLGLTQFFVASFGTEEEYKLFSQELEIKSKEDGKITAKANLEMDIAIQSYNSIRNHVNDKIFSIVKDENINFLDLYSSLRRVEELLSIRSHNHFREYLLYKDQQIDNLHQQKVGIMGQMAAGMAHEIRNPLTSVKGFLQLMDELIDEDKYDPDKLRKYVQICRDEVNSLEGVVSSFLILARKGNTFRTTMETIDILATLNRVHDVSKHFAIEKDVNLTFSYSFHECWIVGFDSYIEQIGLNLIKNAVDAVDVGGHIHVAASIDGDTQQVILSFTDDGPGIPDTRTQHLFEPFYTTKEKGTGLGLSVCKRLVEEMGGTIQIHSTQGKGTKVEIRLPLAERT